MPPTMAYHPHFQRFEPWTVPMVEPPGSRLTTARKDLTTGSTRRGSATTDFGAWGNQGFNLRYKEASSTFFRRNIAPEVVERLPRARSIPNFPGYDPERDRNYFDKANVSLSASRTLALSQGLAGVATQRVDASPLAGGASGSPALRASGSLPRL